MTSRFKIGEIVQFRQPNLTRYGLFRVTAIHRSAHSYKFMVTVTPIDDDWSNYWYEDELVRATLTELERLIYNQVE